MDSILLKQALVGTDKPLTPNSPEENPGRIEAIESLGETITSDSAAWRLLLKAGCHAIAERAGFEPEIETDPGPDASLRDERPAIHSRIVEILFEFLKEYQDQPQVTLHLFRKLEEKRVVFPTETLPRFLDVLSQRRMFKEEGLDTVSKLLGERGRWLAGKNHDWFWASDHPVDEMSADSSELKEFWNEGNFNERKVVLQILVGRDSVTAKRFMKETWNNDKAEHREGFLNLLSESFDDSDVEFLESALSDRSKNVRKIAAACLARLPNSDFARRVRERAERLVVPGKTPNAFQIEPPAEFTKDMKTDGFEEKPPKGVGERSWWLAETLKPVPPTYWETRFERTPPEILALFAKDFYIETLLFAWTHAVLTFDAVDWYEPLWEAWENAHAGKPSDPLDNRTELLVRILPRSTKRVWEKIKGKRFGFRDFRDEVDRAWFQAARDQPLPWPNDFVDGILDYFETTGENWMSMKDFIPFFPAAFRPRLEQLLVRLGDKQQPGYYTNYLEKCREILRQCEEFDELIQAGGGRL